MYLFFLIFFRHECNICKKKFARKQQLNSHIKSFHDKKFSLSFICELCKSDFLNQNLLREHIKLVHEDNLQYKLIKSVFQEKNVLYRKYFASKKILTLHILLQKAEIEEISQTLMNFMISNPFVKYKITVCLSFGKFKNQTLIANDDFHLPSKTETLKLISFENIVESVSNKCFEITERFDDITLRGSEWILLGIKFIDINIVSLKQPSAYFHPRHESDKGTNFRKK